LIPRTAGALGDIELKKAHLKEKLEKLKSEMDRLAAIERQVLAAPDQKISLTDPDSRSIATSAAAPEWSATTCRLRSIPSTIWEPRIIG